MWCLLRPGPPALKEVFEVAFGDPVLAPELIEVYNEKLRERAVDATRPEERKVGDLEALSRASRLSDKLLEAYCVLSNAPQDLFGVGDAEASPRARYSLMGALMVAQDAANAEMERLDPPQPAGE